MLLLSLFMNQVDIMDALLKAGTDVFVDGGLVLVRLSDAYVISSQG